MMLVMVMIDDDDDGDDVDDLPHCIIIIIVIGIADYRESGGGSLSISGEGRPLLSAINSPLRVIVIAVIIVSIVNIVNIYSIDSIIKNGTLSPLRANIILSKIKFALKKLEPGELKRALLNTVLASQPQMRSRSC